MFEPVFTRRWRNWVNECVRFADFGRYVRTAAQWTTLFQEHGAQGKITPIQYGRLHGIACRLQLGAASAAGSCPGASSATPLRRAS